MAAETVEVETEVGMVDAPDFPWPVILGQSGFFSRFTVTMNRLSAHLAVEDVRAFDDRYGVPLAA